MTTPLGIHDISPDVYHRDEFDDTRPSLSSSILKVLLGQSPNHARQRHPRLTEWAEYEWPETDAMKIGSVAHAILLGKGEQFVVFNPSDYYTKDGKPCQTLGCAEAQAAIAKARAEGKIDIAAGLLAKAFGAANTMEADITKEYPSWPRGFSERTLLWQYRLNDGTFVLCRAMLDRIIYSCVCVDDPSEHVHIFDPKFTGKTWADHVIDNTIASDGWDIQAAFYTIGAEKTFEETYHVVQNRPGSNLAQGEMVSMLGLSGSVRPAGLVGATATVAPPVRFTFIVGETYPPYDTRFVTLPDYWLNDARQDVDRGANLWGKCLDANEWPGRPKRYEAKRPEWLSAQRMFADIEEEA